MNQTECPTCGAPMWSGGRCPWDRGSGCVGRSLVASQPRRATERPATPRVASVSTRTRQPAAPRRARAVPKAEYDRQYAAQRRAHRTPEELEAYRAYQREYMKEWRRGRKTPAA